MWELEQVQKEAVTHQRNGPMSSVAFRSPPQRERRGVECACEVSQWDCEEWAYFRLAYFCIL